MPGFERGAIVRVPFPYTDRGTRQHRPALVISNGAVGRGNSLLWVAMITSASNSRWDGDVPLIEGFAECGLPAASLIRTEKIATINAAAAQRLGVLDTSRLAQVARLVASHLGLG